VTAQGEDILAWLDRAITAREQAAQAAADDTSVAWTDGGEYGVAVHTTDLGSAVAVGPWGYMSDETRSFIASNDPDSVLRSCAADRKLLELHGGRGHGCPTYDYDGDLDEFARFYNHEVCPVVQHLAEGYGWTAGQTPPTEGDQVT
jgi:hypothetical protein